ncbi:transglutaminase domain-containing protein [Stenotrophomonas sp. YIM B06876]|uniref:transglutaminase-like domain-containing protein n=1 Tax=Stenotrophomonas sp. YIM B06876 TaxID=3060211 RepID=UPI002739FEDF|nr:transglutaminase domain-containing protein [Stenotrophomonas sp. YIM B06876]
MHMIGPASRRWAAPLLLAFAGATSAAAPAPAPEPLAQLVARIDRGDFAGAQARITDALQRAGLDAQARSDYAFQQERMRRMRLDFSLDEAQAKARVRRWIPDLRDDEFQAWDEAGWIEHLDIDGQRRWFNRAPSNLFRVSRAAAARRAADIPPPTEGPYERLAPHHAEVVAAAQAQGRNSVAPRRVRVTQSIKVQADAVPAGKTVRAWIPFPRAIAGQQDAIGMLASVPAGAKIAPESTLQRTAYLQRTAVAGTPTEFSVSYELTIHARHFAIDPQRVLPTPADPALALHLGERAPHLVFTPALREFSRQVVGDETNPYHITRKLFAAVDRIPWGGAREYSTITNLSDYALHAGHADCGQQTLLLIALLRLNGIPARWQSGMVYSDNAVGYSNLHDWGAVYLAPYGWVPMDVTTGALDSPEPALRDFYLGGLDAYRITFNDDYAQPLVPAKQHFRSETVDSQRGEVEWEGGNLYFDQWDYDFQWQVLPLATP